MESISRPVLNYTIIAVLLLVVTVSIGRAEEERRPPREKWSLTSLQATVKSIDYKTRQAVLEGEAGQLVTIEASEEVARFDQVRAGDKVKAEYWAYVSAEFREPTPAEKAAPLVVLAKAGKAPADFPPGAAIGALVRAVVTVEAIVRPTSEVTIRGPRGQYLTLPVQDKKLLEDLQVGETAVVTYAEALAFSLEKVRRGFFRKTSAE